LINEFYNGHVSLNTNLPSSNRLIPSGQDMFVERRGDKFVITDLRRGYGAEQSGLKIGDELMLFNGRSIAEQMKAFLPKAASSITAEMEQYAVNMLFAGTHDVKRTITVNRNGRPVNYFPDSLLRPKTDGLIETRVLNSTTGYIRINNTLGELAMIPMFDQAVDGFMQYPNLVIDLTETPGGGNTTVARSMMGRFVEKPMPYQQHEFDEKEYRTQRKWVEYVVPRAPRYKGKVYILVGRWTGSMGEGIAIGFDGLGNATIIGTEMAKLLGAISGFTMPETKIGFQIPTERLYHIHGTPRENYRPAVLTRNMEETMEKMRQVK
jgi:carboxyl-terminal processing protease